MTREELHDQKPAWHCFGLPGTSATRAEPAASAQDRERRVAAC